MLNQFNNSMQKRDYKCQIYYNDPRYSFQNISLIIHSVTQCVSFSNSLLYSTWSRAGYVLYNKEYRFGIQIITKNIRNAHSRTLVTVKTCTLQPLNQKLSTKSMFDLIFFFNYYYCHLILYIVINCTLSILYTYFPYNNNISTNNNTLLKKKNYNITTQSSVPTGEDQAVACPQQY